MRERIQKQSSTAGVFFIGFFLGTIVTVLVLIGLAGYMIRHPKVVMNKAVDLGLNQVVNKTIQTAPQAYIGERQDDIAITAQRLAKAYSENRISSAELDRLARKMFAAMADQQITQKEIDDLLETMNRLAQ